MKKIKAQPPANVPATVFLAVALLLQRADREARHTRLQIARAAMNRGEGIFQGCHDESGEPLDAATCDAIKCYLSEPSAERWRAIEGISVAGGGLTLGQWWTRVFQGPQSAAPPSHPRSADLPFLIEVAIAENLASAEASVDKRVP